MPLVLLRRCLSVGPAYHPGAHVSMASSRDKIPSSDSCIMIAVVKVLVTLPIRDSSVGRHGVSVVRFEEPVEETHS
jgi:hypothetical protein